MYNKSIELNFSEMINEQQKSQGIQRYIRLAKIFDFVGTHIITIKKKYPMLYSSSCKRLVYFRIKIFERLNDENINPEDRQIYQECLTLLQGFELSLNL
jgi:hypothetical protein